MRSSIFWVVISLSLLTSCDLEKPVQTQNEKPRACSLKAAQQNQTGIRTIAPADLKVGSDYSTPVISNAQKFVIPVPAFVQGGEPLVYPQSYEKAGQPILDYTGKPLGDRGLVFFNGKDKSWQAVKAMVRELLSSMKSLKNKQKSSIKKSKRLNQTRTI
jgi:hypothetical protein